MLRTLAHHHHQNRYHPSHSHSYSHPQEPELLRLCHSKTWNAVFHRLQSHPTEASPSEASLRGEGSTALALAVRAGAPCTVLEALLQANMHQIAMTHRTRGSVLQEALKHRCGDDVVEFLLTALILYQQKQQASQSISTQRTVSVIPPPVSNHNSNNHVLCNCSDTTGTGTTNTNSDDSSTARMCHDGDARAFQFKHVSVQEQRFLRFPNLLSTVDDMGRTALHEIVESAKRLAGNYRRSEVVWRLFQVLLSNFTEAARIPDRDGHTPLVLLLMRPRGHPAVGNKTESDIARMVQLLLEACPGAATVHRQRVAPATRPWRYSSRHLPHPQHHGNTSANRMVPVVEQGSWCTPLYYAVLHGRSLETIQLLLNDHQKSHQGHYESANVCSTILTQYKEVVLHIAVTTRAPLAILYRLLHNCPQAVLLEDVYNLSPIDWLWIRHVLDWPHHLNASSPLDFLGSRIVSRRRFLPVQFRDWYERVFQHMMPHNNNRNSNNNNDDHHQSNSNHHERSENVTTAATTTSSTTNSASIMNPVAIRSMQEELLQRLKLFLPVAAAVRAAAAGDALSLLQQQKSPPFTNSPVGGGDHTNCNTQKWSLLHAACFVPCPLALVRAALYLDGTAVESISQRDARAGRYPLHYAASRVSYLAHLPVGISPTHVHQVVREPSPVFEVADAFPAACAVADFQQQLPLHIVIDAYNQHRTTSLMKGGSGVDCRMAADENEEEGTTTTTHNTITATTATSNTIPTIPEDEDIQVLKKLLSHFPGALEHLDGKTNLYPWQQAAVGAGASLDAVYFLLRSNPTTAFFPSTTTSTA